MVYPDGSLVKGPKALCELQGYVYGARMDLVSPYPGFAEFVAAARRRKRRSQSHSDRLADTRDKVRS